LFWGRIEGSEKDYYIALGLNFKGYYEFPVKSFYWCTSDFKFAKLDEIDPEYGLSEKDEFGSTKVNKDKEGNVIPPKITIDNVR